MNKKSIGALLLSAALLVGATGSTFAYFTGNADSNQQIITMGNVDVKIDNATGWKLKARADSCDSIWDAFCNGTYDLASYSQMDQDSDIHYKDNIYTDTQDDIRYLAPGDVVVKSFNVTNTGKLDAKINLSLTNIAVTGKTTTTENALNPDKYLFKVYKVDAEGNPTNLVTLKEDARGCGNFLLDPNEVVAVYVTVKLDKLINNDLEDGTVKFNVHVDATQWNNPGWNEDGSSN